MKWTRWRVSGGTRYYLTNPESKWPEQALATITATESFGGMRALRIPVKTVKEAKEIADLLIREGYLHG